MGIHNEPGARRLSPVPPTSELVTELVENLTSTSDPDRSFVPFKGAGDRVVLLVNNLGGTSELEMGVVVAEAKKDLARRGVKVERVIAGTFMVRLMRGSCSRTKLIYSSL
jgi:triose/dihydroxyacetone kinase / FAD-AMP lyase (cyclizing)